MIMNYKLIPTVKCKGSAYKIPVSLVPAVVCTALCLFVFCLPVSDPFFKIYNIKKKEYNLWF